MSTPQSEPKDVYEEVIIPDLQYAIENMKEQAYTSSGGIAEAGRATLPAAQALLGRVCLTMAGFPLYDTAKLSLAEEMLGDVIQYAEKNNKYWAADGDTWKRIWISDNDNKYHIFEVQYVAEKNYGNPVVFMSVPNVGTDYIGIQMSGNRITCSDALAALYEANRADVRYEATVDPKKNYFTKFSNIKSNGKNWDIVISTGK